MMIHDDLWRHLRVKHARMFPPVTKPCRHPDMTNTGSYGADMCMSILLPLPSSPPGNDGVQTQTAVTNLQVAPSGWKRTSSWNWSASQRLSPTVVQTSSSRNKTRRLQMSMLYLANLCIYICMLYLSQLGSASARVWGPKAHGWNKRDSNWIDYDHALSHYIRTMLMETLTIHTQQYNYCMRHW